MTDRVGFVHFPVFPLAGDGERLAVRPACGAAGDQRQSVDMSRVNCPTCVEYVRRRGQ
jgi:hypothetical protein